MLFLSRLIYRCSLQLYGAGVKVAALTGNEKAIAWIEGRKAWRQDLKLKVNNLAAGPRIWLHAASLGEFEQGRPVLEAIKREWPKCQLILTFFSPSGYEQQKKYKTADLIAYLPLDTPANARDFLDIIAPHAALFVKYEFWYFYLKTLAQKRIPTLLFSATFREDQPFFKFYGGLFRQMLFCYDQIQVQDERSLELLKSHALSESVVLGGDTRYDRVLAIAAHSNQIDKIAAFKGEHSLLIAGSTWPADESLLREWLMRQSDNWKLILAPHEIHEAHLKEIEQLFQGQTIRLSQFTGSEEQQVLIIDNIGMLSTLYRYGTIAYIGGGFSRSGIHNTLEAAVYGLPVLMGPHYKKFSEARMLVSKGYAVPVSDVASLQEAFQDFSENAVTLKPQIRDFIGGQAGATDTVLNWLRRHLAQ